MLYTPENLWLEAENASFPLGYLLCKGTLQFVFGGVGACWMISIWGVMFGFLGLGLFIQDTLEVHMSCPPSFLVFCPELATTYTTTNQESGLFHTNVWCHDRKKGGEKNYALNVAFSSIV